MTVEQAPAADGRRSRTRLVVQGVLSLVLVVAIFYYLLTKIDLAQVWTAITDMTWLELSTLGLLAVWNLCTYAFVWMAVTPGLGFLRAMVMTQATTAVANTVPGGSAIGIGIAGLVAAIVIFALMLRSEDQARRFGLLAGRVATRLLRMVRRGPATGWELATVKVRNRTIDLVGHHWVAITVTSLVSHLSLYLVLLVCLRDAGVSDAEVGWAEVLAGVQPATGAPQ